MRRIKDLKSPAILLMIVGYVISFISIFIGISSLEQLLNSLVMMNETRTPIYSLMENSGVALSFEIYLFSLVNCLVVTNYWIISKRRDLSIYKAFGYSNYDLLKLVLKEMFFILLVCLSISILILFIISKLDVLYIAIKISPVFVLGAIGLLLLGLVVALINPVIRILKISPAEGIS